MPYSATHASHPGAAKRRSKMIDALVNKMVADLAPKGDEGLYAWIFRSKLENCESQDEMVAFLYKAYGA